MKKNKRIIIVAKEKKVVDDLQKTFGDLGYKVVAVVSNGKEAIEKVKQFNPDIVMLDIYLTCEINSEIIAEEIKNFENTSVVLFSSFNDSDILNEKSVLRNSMNNHQKIIKTASKLIIN